ncbi:MAG: hypothetical protein P1V97_13055 [Planctomycetota bacterium]|nr:hypothetical protein [Planctomycetota bacterium]
MATSLSGKPLKNVHVNVLAVTVNDDLDDLQGLENGPADVVLGSSRKAPTGSGLSGTNTIPS